MARIRTIKPDFWTDGNMVRMSPYARLLYIGMWNFTLCDHGHVADDPMKLKLQILPMDPVDIEELLAEIMTQGRVVRVSDGEGRTYLHVRRFEDHQKIDPRWKTRCPACARKDSLSPVETPPSFTEPQRDSPNLPLGRDGMGWEGINNTCSPAAPSSESEPVPEPEQEQEPFELEVIEEPTPDPFDEFWEHYPNKVAKKPARAKFAAAAKRADPQAIIDGARRLAQDPNLPEQKYIPHPTTWLEQDRWNDPPLAPQRGSRAQQGIAAGRALYERAQARPPRPSLKEIV